MKNKEYLIGAERTPERPISMSLFQPPSFIRRVLFLTFDFLLLTFLTGVTDTTLAQQTVSPCQPPQSDEYLLFVLSQTQANHQIVQQTLPPNAQSSFCRYLEDTVTRVPGFRRLEDATNWARYVQEIAGLSAFVVRPSRSNPSTNVSAYNPQPLGEGYAVLVDYFNQPEVAAEVQQLIGRDVGLVSYAQRPYLLAVHTTSQRAANSMLRKLSDRGFWSMVVDSGRVTLLSPAVSF